MSIVSILDIVFPKRCVGCGRIGTYICSVCSMRITCIDPAREAICPVCEKSSINGMIHPRCTSGWGIDGLTSFFRYDGVVKKAVKAVKYRLVSDLCEKFVGLVPSTSYIFLQKVISEKKPVIIPIPLHSSRFRERGFNQAEILGSLVAVHLNVPVRWDVLRRTRQNTQGVFAVNNITMKQWNNEAILLFDDVFTTGATMRAAAMVLKRAGAKWVWGVTMAR